MVNNYVRMLLVSCCLLVASYASAQFRFGDKPEVGQTLTIDTETGIATFLLNFNTNKQNSYWTQDSVINISFQKCQTNRGFQSEVFDTSAQASTVFNDDFKTRRWNSNENPVHIASIDSLKSIFNKWAEKYAGTADTIKNVIWKPSASLFDVDGDDTNQAFGTHPGMYKRVEYGFQFSFSGTAVTTDIEFEIDTYDAGNTGQTATYELVVSVGSESNVVGTITDFYVSGSGKKTVKLAEAIGVDFATFSDKKVYFKVKTLGTGTAVAMDSFDPTIVFDNMTVSYQLPVWIDPPAGAAGNTILGNASTPLVSPIDVAVLDSIHLQSSARFGALTIVNDLQNKMVQNLTFLETGALKANDGNGNYTVDVPYTIEPGVLDQGTLEWSKAKITVAAPDSPIDDDMMFYFNATPTSSSLHFARLELNSGTRIWYDFYMKGIIPGKNLIYVGALGPDNPNLSDSTSIAKLEAAGYSVTLVDDNDVSDGGYDYSGYDAVVFGESTSSSRIVAFGKTDNYPIPAVILEPLAVRDDKWGWVADRAANFTENRDCLEGTDSMTIMDNTHYITSAFEQDQVFAWTTATCGAPETVAAFGFNLNEDITGAIALAKNNSTGVTTPNLWAIPAGTLVEGGTKATTSRIVLFGIHEFGLYGKDADMTEYATADFYTLLTRSVDWVLQEDPLGTAEREEFTREILAYPNPAKDQVTLRFDLQNPTKANLYLVNMMGQRVELFRNQQFLGGTNEVQVSLNGLARGIYVYKLEAEGKAFIGKLTITE